VPDPSGGQDLLEGVGAIAGAVVGHDLLHPDPESDEPGQRPAGEASCGVAALIGMDLHIGHSRAVVYGDV
jgi:hypothetical protein